MTTILLLYGLAFFVMGISVLIAPKKNDVLDLGENLWFLGLFGVLHGLNEWAEMSALRYPGESFFTLASAALLPVSFIFLLLFGTRALLRNAGLPASLAKAPVFLIVIWIVYALRGGGSAAARYFLCVPASFIAASAIALAANRKRVYRLPPLVRAGAIFAAAGLIFYGILAGLVSPDTTAILPGRISYDAFSLWAGAPVQLFRLVCAVVISIALVLATLTAHVVRDRVVFRGGIRTKVSVTVFVGTVATMIFMLIILYALGTGMIWKTIESNHKEIARTASVALMHAVDSEIEDAFAYAVRPQWIDRAEAANAEYAGLTTSEITQALIDKDASWRSCPADTGIVKETIFNGEELGMQDILGVRKAVAEIFMTDMHGAVVAASAKTTDFFQADEEWWQLAYNGGAGGVYLSDVEYDSSSGKYVIVIAVPIKGRASGVVGVLKILVSTEKLFGLLADFGLGDTGHVSVMDSLGNYIFHPGAPTMSRKAGDTEKVVSAAGSQGYYRDDDLYLRAGKRVFTVVTRVEPPVLAGKSFFWYLLISQDVEEAVEPLYRIVSALALVMLMVIVTAAPTGYALAGIFTQPIHRLKRAVEEINSGNWDHPVYVETGDELEMFSEAFRQLIANVRAKQSELLAAKTKLEELSKNLELKVEQRTKDLAMAQEATLNILEDLTEAKERLEAESRALAQALEIKSNFTSTVSHELRTPLAAIKEGIAIVLDGTAGKINKEQSDFLAIARRNVDRLTRLVNDVLDFQKLERHGIPFNMAENSINETVSEAAASMAQLIESKGLTLTLETDDSLPKINFDKDRINQVLINLIGNSVKFTDRGGITVKTSKGENFIQVSVSDTGQGIALKVMPRLFRQFDQLASDTGRKIGGTGLGLAICKNIIDSHNGKIWAESDLGAGSTFSFLLPIRERRTQRRD